MKFTTSPSIQLKRTIETGAYWAVRLKLTVRQIRRLEPLTYNLVKGADAVKYHYPHAKYATQQPFSEAWKNYWPGYVQGSMKYEGVPRQAVRQPSRRRDRRRLVRGRRARPWSAPPTQDGIASDRGRR